MHPTMVSLFCLTPTGPAEASSSQPLPILTYHWVSTQEGPSSFLQLLLNSSKTWSSLSTSLQPQPTVITYTAVIFAYSQVENSYLVQNHLRTQCRTAFHVEKTLDINQGIKVGQCIVLSSEDTYQSTASLLSAAVASGAK